MHQKGLRYEYQLCVSLQKVQLRFPKKSRQFTGSGKSLGTHPTSTKLSFFAHLPVSAKSAHSRQSWSLHLLIKRCCANLSLLSLISRENVRHCFANDGSRRPRRRTARHDSPRAVQMSPQHFAETLDVDVL